MLSMVPNMALPAICWAVIWSMILRSMSRREDLGFTVIPARGEELVQKRLLSGGRGQGSERIAVKERRTEESIERLRSWILSSLIAKYICLKPYIKTRNVKICNWILPSGYTQTTRNKFLLNTTPSYLYGGAVDGGVTVSVAVVMICSVMLVLTC